MELINKNETPAPVTITEDIQVSLNIIFEEAKKIIELEKTDVDEYKKQISIFYKNFQDVEIQNTFELILDFVRSNQL